MFGDYLYPVNDKSLIIYIPVEFGLSEGAAAGAGIGICVNKLTPTPAPNGELTDGVNMVCIIPGGPSKLCMLGGGTPIGTLGINPCVICRPM